MNALAHIIDGTRRIAVTISWSRKARTRAGLARFLISGPASLAPLGLCLLLGGCGGCQGETGAPAGTESGKPASSAPAAKAPVDTGKIQVPAVKPQTGAAPSNLPPAANAPAPAPEPDEGDCIVVADANPDYGSPPLEVAFTAEAECTGGQPSYKWDFGDETPPGNEANPSHTYAQPGDYVATVTVTGPDGAIGTDEIDITVEEGEAEPLEE